MDVACERKKKQKQIKLVRHLLCRLVYYATTFRVVSEMEHKQKEKKKRRDGEKMPHRRGVYSELATVVVVVTQSRENQNPRWGFPFEIAKGTSGAAILCNLMI